MNKDFKFLSTFIRAFMIIGAGMIFLSGCGLKSPPIPPDQVLPNQVVDLRKRIEGDTLILSWTIPEKKTYSKTIIYGFTVYRSKVSVADGDCPECPLIFKIIGDVPVYSYRNKDGMENIATFYEILEMGYSYTYKVVGYTKKNVKSEDSNHIQFYY